MLKIGSIFPKKHFYEDNFTRRPTFIKNVFEIFYFLDTLFTKIPVILCPILVSLTMARSSEKMLTSIHTWPKNLGRTLILRYFNQEGDGADNTYLSPFDLKIFQRHCLTGWNVQSGKHLVADKVKSLIISLENIQKVSYIQLHILWIWILSRQFTLISSHMKNVKHMSVPLVISSVNYFVLNYIYWICVLDIKGGYQNLQLGWML